MTAGGPHDHSRCRSCSCSFTSIIFSECLTDDSELVAPRGAPRCTCPHPMESVLTYAGPLHTMTCLPQPLPATPHVSRVPREPDYLRLEKTVVSDTKPFLPQEPQPVYYARSFPKHVGEPFSCHYDPVLRLRRYHKSMAEWIVPRDAHNTPFHSVVYLKTHKQAEMREEGEVEPRETVLVGEQDQLWRVPTGVVELLSTASNECNSIYKAMGSTSSGWEQSTRRESEEEADRLVGMWQKVFVERGSTSCEQQEWTVPVYDSGDETRFSTSSESQPPPYDLLLWYHELDKMDQFLEKTKPTRPSLSALSCSTASSIPPTSTATSLVRTTPTSTVADRARTMGRALYDRILGMFLAQEKSKSSTSFK